MKILKLDIDKTYDIYNKAKHLLEKGKCYNNCVNVLAQLLINDYKNGKYKIGYCYVGGEDHLLTRHCIIITDKDEIIDVTTLLIYNLEELNKIVESSDIRYFVFAELDSMQLYFALEKSNNNPALKDILMKKEKELYEYIKNTNLEINSIDFNTYIKDFIS